MANAELRFIPSSRGGRFLILQGFKFKSNKKRHAWESWQCVVKDCPARVSTVNDLITKMGTPHNHQNMSTEIKVSESLMKITAIVADSTSPAPMMYQEEVNKLREGEWNDDNRELITAMPTFQSLRSTLYRARNKNLPKLPKTRREIEIPEQFSKTAGGEDFLLINDGADDKILGFATSANLELLCDADTVYGDGTFYVVPRIFYQLYTLHAMVDGSMFPLVFFMLPDKKEVTYQRMFRLLRDAAAAKAHPNIFEFISFLKKEQSTTETLLVQYQWGMKKPPTKKQYRTIEARFQLLKVRLANGTISLMEYADACAGLLKNF